MNEIYGGLSSSPVNKIDVAMSGDRTITFGGTVVETPVEIPEKIVLVTISPQTDPASTGTVTGGGVYQVGTQATVVATPDSESEYPEFDGWYEGETKVSENASYTFTVEGARTLVAKFKKNSVYKGHAISSEPSLPASVTDLQSITVYVDSEDPTGASVGDVIGTVIVGGSYAYVGEHNLTINSIGNTIRGSIYSNNESPRIDVTFEGFRGNGNQIKIKSTSRNLFTIQSIDLEW